MRIIRLEVDVVGGSIRNAAGTSASAMNFIRGDRPILAFTFMTYDDSGQEIPLDMSAMSSIRLSLSAGRVAASQRYYLTSEHNVLNDSSLEDKSQGKVTFFLDLTATELADAIEAVQNRDFVEGFIEVSSVEMTGGKESMNTLLQKKVKIFGDVDNNATTPARIDPFVTYPEMYQHVETLTNREIFTPEALTYLRGDWPDGLTSADAYQMIVEWYRLLKVNAVNDYYIYVCLERETTNWGDIDQRNFTSTIAVSISDFTLYQGGVPEDITYSRISTPYTAYALPSDCFAEGDYNPRPPIVSSDNPQTRWWLSFMFPDTVLFALPKVGDKLCFVLKLTSAKIREIQGLAEREAALETKKDELVAEIDAELTQYAEENIKPDLNATLYKTRVNAFAVTHGAIVENTNVRGIDHSTIICELYQIWFRHESDGRVSICPDANYQNQIAFCHHDSNQITVAGDVFLDGWLNKSGSQEGDEWTIKWATKTSEIEGLKNEAEQAKKDAEASVNGFDANVTTKTNEFTTLADDKITAMQELYPMEVTNAPV